MTLITRVGFCPDCFKRNRPRTDQMYIVHGTTHDVDVLKYATKIGIRGFTPHIYELEKVIDRTVIYRSICTMHLCGIDIFFHKQGWNFMFRDDMWKRGATTIENWNALVQFKRTGYEI